MQSRNDIGFGKKIRACWLESAVEQAARGITFDQAKEPIAKEISADNAGAEAIRKILTGLKRVWFTARLLPSAPRCRPRPFPPRQFSGDAADPELGNGGGSLSVRWRRG